MLMGIAYNIHVIVRCKRIGKFYFSSLNLLFISLYDDERVVKNMFSAEQNKIITKWILLRGQRKRFENERRKLEKI